MIKTKHGNSTILGSAEELCADYSCIIKALNSAFSRSLGADVSKELLETAHKDGFKSDDEIVSEITAELDKLGDKHEEIDKIVAEIKKMLLEDE